MPKSKHEPPPELTEYSLLVHVRKPADDQEWDGPRLVSEIVSNLQFEGLDADASVLTVRDVRRK
jgi:hypothetical protein